MCSSQSFFPPSFFFIVINLIVCLVYSHVSSCIRKLLTFVEKREKKNMTIDGMPVPTTISIIFMHIFFFFCFFLMHFVIPSSLFNNLLVMFYCFCSFHSYLLICPFDEPKCKQQKGGKYNDNKFHDELKAYNIIFSFFFILSILMMIISCIVDVVSLMINKMECVKRL